jgi:transposase
MGKSFILHFLPEGILLYFEVDSVYELWEISTRKAFFYKIDLVECNEVLGNYIEEEYEFKGFYEPKQVQDFPLRGKAVYLEFKRRRWRHKLCKKESVMTIRL